MILTRLRELRIDNDFKQAYIANYLNISQNTYSQYESGRRTLPYDLFVKLCLFYNVSADYILFLTNEKRCLIVK